MSVFYLQNACLQKTWEAELSLEYFFRLIPETRSTAIKKKINKKPKQKKKLYIRTPTPSAAVFRLFWTFPVAERGHYDLCSWGSVRLYSSVKGWLDIGMMFRLEHGVASQNAEIVGCGKKKG